MTEWLQRGLIPTTSSVSVNVSTMQLNDPRLLDIAKNATHSGTALRPHNLNLEITETALMENPEASLQVFKHLTKLGIGLHVDDFGTGYSSFSYLTQMPINALKVDRSFIARMQQNPKEFEIVRLVINLTKTLGIEAIAEGVEDESVLKSLCNQTVRVRRATTSLAQARCRYPKRPRTTQTAFRWTLNFMNKLLLLQARLTSDPMLSHEHQW